MGRGFSTGWPVAGLMRLFMIDRLRRGRPAALPALGAMALLVGIAALVVPTEGAHSGVSWEGLLAPYSHDAPLPHGFRIGGIRRGPENDVIVSIHRPAEETAAIEVHILARGRWTGIRESQSFGIAYETPHSPAAEREAITEALADTIRSRDQGLPSPDAIPLGSSFDPSALPWWLEMLRGWRGVLLGASVVLLALIAQAPLWISPRDSDCHGGRHETAWSLTAAAFGTIDVIVGIAGIPGGHPDLGGVWVVPAGTVLLFIAFRGRIALAPDDRRLALAIAATALLLRLGLGPWGPLHVNGYAPLFVVAAARDPAAVAAYGPGYVEIFGPIAALAPTSPDWAIFAFNAVLSALLPLLAFALGRLTGLARGAAAAAAFLLAIDPIAIRMAASESYFPPIIFLCLAAGVALLAGTRAMEAGGGWRGAVGAALLLVQAARIHPCAWVLAATVPFVVLAGTAGTVRGRLVAFVAGGVMIGGMLVASSGGVLLDVLGNMRSGTVQQPFAPPSLRPLVWIAAAAMVYAVLAPRRWLAAPAGVSIAAGLLTRQLYGESWLWQHAYDRLYLTLPLIAVVGAVPAAFWRRRWLVLASALPVAFAWVSLGVPIIVERTTDQLEYRWLRRQLTQVPPRCRVIHLASVEKRALIIPTYVRPREAPAVAMVPREPHTLDQGLSPAECLYYVRTSLCSSVEGRPACEAIEGRLVLVPVSRVSFPARPSRDRIPYDSDPVETVIARVDGVEAADPRLDTGE